MSREPLWAGATLSAADLQPGVVFVYAMLPLLHGWAWMVHGDGMPEARPSTPIACPLQACPAHAPS